MKTVKKPVACARALLWATLALGCGEDPAQPAQMTSHPDEDELSDADRARSTELLVRAPEFLGFPERAADAALAPELLSATGAFADVSTLRAAAGLIPYGVQNPLWSDGAHKRRWLAVPEGGKIGFSATGQWSFPEGTVLVKHFAMALDEGHPDQLRNLETRFWIVARGGEFYGLVYRWDEDQQDAHLLLDGASEQLSITGADGVARTQTYSYPAATACKNCHSPSAGHVRGVRTLQLNGDFDYGAAHAGNDAPANQLATLDGLGLFAEPIGDPAQYGQLASIDDERAPLEARVRSYWDSNCSSCHNDSPTSPSWDARYTTPLAEQRVLMAVPLGGAGDNDLRLIVPGAPERSWIFLRDESEQPGVRMPPLLRNRVDQRYIDVLRAWILSLEQQ